MSTIYQKFTGRSRDSFKSLADARDNFKLSYSNNFNFAYDVTDVLAK